VSKNSKLKTAERVDTGPIIENRVYSTHHHLTTTTAIPKEREREFSHGPVAIQASAAIMAFVA